MFIGQFNRLTATLDLLSEGRVARIFISGANARAGISPATFAEQFKLSDALKRELATSGIVLATDANGTLENGCETVQWLAENPDIQSVVLITSRFYMPRAFLSLRRATDRHILIECLSVDDAHAIKSDLIVEFMKFTAMFFMRFVPSAWADQRSGICQASSLG